MENKKKKTNDKKIFFVVTIIALAVDQILKIIAIKNGHNIVSEEGTSENNGYYIVLSIILVVLIIRYLSTENTYIKNSTKIVTSFAVAGVLSNMIDRIWYKDVITFINVGDNIAINLSYIYIILAWVGMAILLTKNTMSIMKDRKKQKEMLEEYEKNREQINKDFKDKKEENNIKKESEEKNNTNKNKSNSKKNTNKKVKKNGKKKHNNR